MRIAPTQRYGHAVLGDAIEAGGLRAILRDGRTVDYMLGEDSVFEDLRPRLADLDGDGRDEIILVRSYLAAGAALAVFGLRAGPLELLGETSPVGTPHRWLNPVGVGDFDGDGSDDILIPAMGRRALKIVSSAAGRFRELATIEAEEPISGDVLTARSDGAEGLYVAIVLRPGRVMGLQSRPTAPAPARSAA